jgi:hypothetical protein
MSDGITTDLSSLERSVKKLILPEAMIHKIMALTITRTARWARNHISRELRKVKFDMKLINGRLRLNIDKGDANGAQIWFGLDGVSLGKFNPIQTASGVHTDVMDVPGAFLGAGRLSLGKKSWDSRFKNASGSDMSGAVFKRRGASRLPIDKQFYDMASVGNPIFDKTVSEVVNALAKNFEKSYLDVISK